MPEAATSACRAVEALFGVPCLRPPLRSPGFDPPPAMVSDYFIATLATEGCFRVALHPYSGTGCLLSTSACLLSVGRHTLCRRVCAPIETAPVPALGLAELADRQSMDFCPGALKEGDAI